jgi:tetratricopeptide (TPR) repeat protein
MLSGAQSASPYKGLLPYSERDAPFFFGREEETVIISANLFASPLTLLYGASGVGKSSVLHAGVAHQLRMRDDLLVVVFSTWQGDPIVELKTAVTNTISTIKATNLRSYNPLSLAEFLIECAKETNRRLLIILDQFEEYFLYHPKDDAFAAEFPLAVMQSDAPISFLLSLREDSLAKLDRFEGRIPILFDNYLRIEHLDYKAAREAIEKPLDQYNRLISTGEGQVGIEPDLVEAVLKQVETGRVLIGAAGRGVVKTENTQGHIETPYLQLVMTRLWDEEMRNHSLKLRLETFNEHGGANSIVRTHLDAAMSSLPANEQDIAANIFHYLVTPSGTKIAHSITDLSEYANIPQEQLSPVLEKLSRGDQRILRGVAPPLDRPQTLRYEIYHDVLASAILDWRSRYIQEKVRIEAERQAEEQQWQAEEKVRAREQAKVALRLRRLAVALVIMVLLTGAAAVFATAQLMRARTNEREAVSARQRAEDERERANQQSQLATSRLADVESAKQRETEARKVAEEQTALAKQQTDLAKANEQKAITAGVRADEERKRALEQAQLAATRAKEAERAKAAAMIAQRTAEAERARAENQAKLLAASLKKVKTAQEKEVAARQKAEVAMQREAEKARQLATALDELKRERVESDASQRTDKLNRDALSLYQSGKYDQAIIRYNEALKIYREIGNRVGEADTLSNIGKIFRQQVRFESALASYNAALATFLSSEKENPRIANIYNNRGEVYSDIGEYNRALADFNHALSIQMKLLSPNNQDVAVTLKNTGLVYAQLGDYSQALMMYEQALKLQEKSVGPESIDVADNLNNLAAIYLQLGDYDRAESLLLRTLSINEKRLGLEHPQVAAPLINLALLYSLQKNYKQAESLAQRALVIYEKALGTDHPSVASALEVLAAIYASQNKFAQAEPLSKRALAMLMKVFGPMSPQVAQSLNALAKLYSDQARYSEALPLYQRALVIQRNIKSAFDEADTLTKLAELYLAQSNYAQAEPLLKQALSIFEEKTGTDSQKVVEVLELYIEMLRKTGRNIEADKLEVRIKTIQSKNPK